MSHGNDRRKMGHIWLSCALQLQRSHHMDIRAKGMLGASIVFLYYFVILIESKINKDKEDPFIW
jgi:hypothetical protein